MSVISETPFSLLRRMKDDKEFDKQIIDNWYIARAYVLEKLKDVFFMPDSKDYLHVVVVGDSPLMLSVVRQVALTAHYVNYEENNEDESFRHRTVITIESHLSDKIIKEELEKEEYLYNLPKFCKFLYKDSIFDNQDSFIDIEIHIVDNYSGKCLCRLTEEDVKAFSETKKQEGVDIYCIDTRKAIYASRMYELGALINNLPAEDIHCMKRYNLALDFFQFEKLKVPLQSMFDKNDDKSQCELREKISNVFCADCFESRYNTMLNFSDDSPDKLEKLHEALAKTEHARWVVEKLIMGYSPLNEQQRYMDENLFLDKDKRKEYRNGLKKAKNNPSHIDLCSYQDLRRVNPDDLKFDSFLMLAIPKILEKVKEDDR